MKLIKIYMAVDSYNKYKEKIKHIDYLVSMIYGGFTRYKTIGGWIDANNLFQDNCGIVYEIYVEDKKFNKKDLKGILNYMVKYFNQISILVNITKVSDHFYYHGG